MKIKISVETTADLSKEILTERDISVIPFTIQLGDRSALDGEITSDEIIEYAIEKKVLPKTSAINEYQYTEHFENLLKENDAVIHFSLSSELSVACSNAMRASKAFKNVYVVDTRSLSTGIGLLAMYASDLVKEGKNAEEIYKACQERLKDIQASFELKCLDFLYKGGRCSALSFFGANLLKIRPQILVKDGKMVPGKKYRGNFSHVVKSYCQDVLDEYDNPDLTRAFVTYTTAEDEIIETAKEYLKQAGFKEIYVTRAGGTITSHCGEGCLGILYINDGKN